jgi:hypothetical protein
MLIIYVTLRQQIWINKDVKIHKCTLNPIGGNLVTSSSIHVNMIFMCINGLGLSVVCVYVNMYTHTCIWFIYILLVFWPHSGQNHLCV